MPCNDYSIGHCFTPIGHFPAAEYFGWGLWSAMSLREMM